MSKKTVLITGATRGIGKAILEAFNNDYLIIGTGTSEESLSSITENLKSLKIEGKAFKLDLNDRQSIKALSLSLDKEEIYPDILINNAGITRDNIMLRMQEDEWDDVINIHLNGQYLLIKSFLKKMVKNRWGRVINITSVVGHTGNIGQANYCASKMGIIGMSKSLALEVAKRGITINCISPGFIDTKMTQGLDENTKKLILEKIPLGKIGEPKDISNCALFIASENSNYITGQTFHVNGGLTMI